MVGVPWDQPGADPVSDIKAMLAKIKPDYGRRYLFIPEGPAGHLSEDDKAKMVAIANDLYNADVVFTKPLERR